MEQVDQALTSLPKTVSPDLQEGASRRWLGTLLILLFAALFCLVKLWHHDLSLVHLLFACLILVLFFAHSLSRQLLVIGIPIALFAIFYDFFRYIPFHWLMPIHIQDLFQWDKALFGIHYQGELVLFHQFVADFFSSKFFDFYAGFFYSLHVPAVIILLIVFWRFHSAQLAQRYTVAFLLMNLLAFVTHFFFPTAAPWYVEKFGFIQPLGPVLGDAAGLVNFENLLGIKFFTNNYQIGAIVFGAVPSMHAGFSALGFFYSLQVSKKLAWVTGFYMLSICFSAMYLQHHYLIDVILGVLYALVAWFCIEKLFPREVKRINDFLWRFFAQNSSGNHLKKKSQPGN